jgi:hypothetical protein
MEINSGGTPMIWRDGNLILETVCGQMAMLERLLQPNSDCREIAAFLRDNLSGK